MLSRRLLLDDNDKKCLDTVYANVYQEYENDTSFDATDDSIKYMVKLLFGERLNNEHLTFATHYLDCHSYFDWNNNEEKQNFDDIYDVVDNAKNSLVIILASYPEQTQTVHDKMISDGCINPTIHTDYLKQLLSKDEYEFVNSDQFWFTTYIKEETNTAVVLTSNRKRCILHYIAGILPSLFGSYATDLSQQKIELCEKILTSRFESSFRDSFHRLCLELPMYNDIMLDNMLTGFSLGVTNAKINTANEEICNLQSRMDDLLAQYRMYSKNLEAQQIQLVGLRELSRDTDMDNELIDFVKRHNITVYKSDKQYGYMSFGIHTSLEFFDPDGFDRLMSNDRSFLNQLGDYSDYILAEEFFDADNRNMVLKKIFLDCTWKINVAVGYFIRLSSREYGRSTDVLQDELSAAWNPHIEYYDCFGDYGRSITECLCRGDVIGTLQQCILSAKSINVMEEPTMARFVADIFGKLSRTKFITTEDGELITPYEGYERLKGE